MARHLARQLGVVALVGAVAWGSCSVYDESMLLQGLDGGGGSGGTGGGSGGGTGGGTEGGQCISVQPPDLPTGTDPGGDIKFVVAMRTIDFGEPYRDADGGNVPARALGYDLDGKVTRDGCTTNSCVNPSFGSGEVDDFEDGRDNGLGKLITDISRRVPNFGSRSYSQQIAEGKVSLLWQVSGYNGEPNDPKVTLTMFTPAALNAFGTGRTEPEWDGLDEWPIADVSFIDGDPTKPKYTDPNAYVRDGVLVGAMASADLRLKVGITQTILVELILQYKQAFFTADIVRITRDVTTAGGGTESKQLWTLQNGQIAGRWNVDDLLNQIDQFPDPNDLQKLPPICRDRGSYQVFRDLICGFVDIRDDLQAATAPCNALSIGMGFHAEQALAGNVYGLQQLVDRCPGEPLDSCFEPFVPLDAGGGGSGGQAGMSGAAGASSN